MVTILLAANAEVDRMDKVCLQYTVHTSYNLNVTRVYHACVDHKMDVFAARVSFVCFISYTTNT